MQHLLFYLARFSSKDRGTVVFPPLLSPENFFAYFSSALWEEREKEKVKKKKNWMAALFELLVKSGRQGGG